MYDVIEMAANQTELHLHMLYTHQETTDQRPESGATRSKEKSAQLTDWKLSELIT